MRFMFGDPPIEDAQRNSPLSHSPLLIASRLREQESLPRSQVCEPFDRSAYVRSQRQDPTALLSAGSRSWAPDRGSGEGV